MGISKRPDSPFWWYDFTVQGNRFRGSTETTARGDAEKVEAKLRSDALLGKLTNKKTEMTIDAAFGRYWLTHACELSSAEVTDWHLEAIKTAMKPTTTLSRITDNELAHAVAKWRGEGQSGATCNRRLTVFRAVLRMARDRWGAEVSMPNWKAHAQREAAKRDPHLSPAKAEELIANAAPHLRPAIRFSLLTGVRLANCIELDWSQIDLPGRVMRFMVKSKADGGKPLTVPISGDLLALLVSLGPQQEGPVFTYQPRRRHGTLGPAVAIGSFRRSWATALRKTGITNFRWHDLRHVAASWMVQGGAPIEVVKEALGHENIETTMRYAHHENTAVRDALELAAARLRHGVTVADGEVTDIRKQKGGRR
jgi:integrase